MSSNTQTPTISAQTMNEYIASISEYFYENDDHIYGRVRFLWSQLDGTPFSRGEQNLAGWNSMDESKRGGNESFKDKPYTYEEEEEERFTCKCCGDSNLDVDDGIDCPECCEYVCDECVISDENDPHCKTDRCVLCDKGNPEDCLVVPDYEKHLLDKKCRYCGVGHMKQKTPDGLYHQLHENCGGEYCCDGECAMTELRECFAKV